MRGNGLTRRPCINHKVVRTTPEFLFEILTPRPRATNHVPQTAKHTHLPDQKEILQDFSLAKDCWTVKLPATVQDKNYVPLVLYSARSISLIMATQNSFNTDTKRTDGSKQSLVALRPIIDNQDSIQWFQALTKTMKGSITKFLS